MKLYLAFLTIIFMFPNVGIVAAEDCSHALVKDLNIKHESELIYQNLFKLMSSENYQNNKDKFKSAFGYEGWSFTGDYSKDRETLDKHLSAESRENLDARDLILIHENLSDNAVEAYSKCVLANATAEGIYVMPTKITAAEVSFKLKYIAAIGKAGTATVTVMDDWEHGCTFPASQHPIKNSIKLRVLSGGPGQPFIVNRGTEADCLVSYTAPINGDTVAVPAFHPTVEPQEGVSHFLTTLRNFVSLLKCWMTMGMACIEVSPEKWR